MQTETVVFVLNDDRKVTKDLFYAALDKCIEQANNDNIHCYIGSKREGSK